MSEQTSQEPTMEEILASIRRIISEDDAPAEEGAAEAQAPDPVVDEEPEPVAIAPPPPEPEPEAAPAPTPPPIQAAAPPAPEPEPEPEEDDLELTQKVESHGDLDVLAPVAPEPAAAPAAAIRPGLVSETAAVAAASAFGQLSAAIGMPRSDRTLEDVVRELLQPLLKQWLDDNLAGIVHDAVQAEVERIARSRR